MKIKTISLAVSLLLACMARADLDIPEEFSELFEFRERNVTLKDLDGTGKTSLILNVSYDSVKLPDSKDETIEKLNSYFKRNGITDAMAERILNSLAHGVKNVESCQGYINECVVLPEDHEFYYDYENALLTLFVNGAELDKPKANLEYATAKNEHSALINHVDLYSSYFNDSSSSYSMNNKSILGLPYGHVKSDFTVSDSNKALYELSYDLSFSEKNRVYAGRFNNGVSFNSTDIVSPSRYIQQTSLNFGSTNNLLMNRRENTEQIFFFSPASGELRVLRDGRVIKQLQISEGQGSLSYSDLPSGRYDIELEVVAGGKVISSEKRTVYNDLVNMPTVGNSDFVFSVGQLNEARAQFLAFDEYDSLSLSQPSRFDDALFASALFSKRMSEPFMVAAGGFMADSESMATMGAQWYLPAGGNINGSASIYSHGAFSYDARFGTKYYSLSYERMKHSGAHSDTLASYLMGPYNYEKLSGNLFVNFDNGVSSYYTHTVGKYKYPKSGDLYTRYDTSTIGLGYNLPVLNARLDLAFDFDHVSNGRSANLTLQVPLISDWETKLSSYGNSSGYRENRASVVKNNFLSRENMSSSLEISSVYANTDNSILNEMYAAASINESVLRGTANLYANDQGNHGLSGSLSSTQVVTANGVNVTGQKADAYAIIDAEINNINEDSSDPYGFVTIRKNNKLDNKQFIYGPSQVIPITAYNNYNVAVDSESVSLYNSGDLGIDAFAYPGSSLTIKPSLKPVVTFVSAFSDLFDEPVDEIECKGFGCIDVSKVMDGVFRVTLVEGSDFTLYAGAERCLVPSDYEDAELMNFGNNYCLPDAKPRSIISVNNQKTSKSSEVYYVGSFDDTDVVNDYIDRLSSLGGTLYQKKVGSDIALYLLLENEGSMMLSKAQQLVIDSMQLYAREIHILNKINQPVAMH